MIIKIKYINVDVGPGRSPPMTYFINTIDIIHTKTTHYVCTNLIHLVHTVHVPDPGTNMGRPPGNGWLLIYAQWMDGLVGG